MRGRRRGVVEPKRRCVIDPGWVSCPLPPPQVSQLLDAYPPSRPLILIIKTFLRQRKLNEVFTGGLSTYSISLMVSVPAPLSPPAPLGDTPDLPPHSVHKVNTKFTFSLHTVRSVCNLN